MTKRVELSPGEYPEDPRIVTPPEDLFANTQITPYPRTEADAEAEDKSESYFWEHPEVMIGYKREGE